MWRAKQLGLSLMFEGVNTTDFHTFGTRLLVANTQLIIHYIDAGIWKDLKISSGRIDLIDLNMIVYNLIDLIANSPLPCQTRSGLCIMALGFCLCPLPPFPVTPELLTQRHEPSLSRPRDVELALRIRFTKISSYLLYLSNDNRVNALIDNRVKE